MTLLVKAIYNGDDVVALGELTPEDKAEITGSLVVESDSQFNSSGAVKIPAGLTIERPVDPLVGDFRFNVDLGYEEVWDGTEWVGGAPMNVSADPDNAAYLGSDGFIYVPTIDLNAAIEDSLDAFQENLTTVDKDHVIATGTHALSIGTIVIPPLTVVTVAPKAKWIILD